jgi:hypothetical protein
MDSSRVDDAHPAFGHIMKQLSPDEALILFHLKQQKYRMRQYQAFHIDKNWFDAPIEEMNEFPLACLARAELYVVAMEHLQHLNLAGAWQCDATDFLYNEQKIQTGTRKTFEARLTKFGEMFARACVPDELPT